MRALRLLLSTFLLSGLQAWPSGASSTVAAPQDVATLRQFLVHLEGETRSWPATLDDLAAAMERLHVAAGSAALRDAKTHVERVRGLAVEGVGEAEAYDVANFKCTKARLYLSLARAAMSRALTAAVTAPEPSSELTARLTAFIAEIDRLVPVEAPSEEAPVP